MSWFNSLSFEKKVRVVGGFFVTLLVGCAVTSFVAPAAAGFVALAMALVGCIVALAAGRLIGVPISRLAAAVESFVARESDMPALYTDRADCVGRINREMIRMREIGAELITDRDAGQRDLRDAVAVLGKGLERLAQGRAGEPITTPFGEGCESLRIDFNRADAQLADLLTCVARVSSGIITGASEIAQAADDLSRRTEQQASSLEQTAAAMADITSTVRETAQGAAHVNKSVGEAHHDAEVGGRIVRDAVTAMAGIEKSSAAIGQIVTLIDGIAFQTNLLALNAGVEAARAGDAGKGFAVVANEVRALAQRSADAARDIKELIATSSAQVETGVQLVGQTGQALDRIVTRVAEIAALIAQISSAAETQASNLQQVNGVMGEMDKMTQQNAAMVEQCSAASRSLRGEAESLGGLVRHFDTKMLADRRQPAEAAPERPRKGAPRKPVAHGNLALAVEPSDEDWAEF
jgi:methyl-accepting chemotaxis protein